MADMHDMSGVPRSEEEIKGAIVELKRLLIFGIEKVPPKVAVYFPTILDALNETLQLRKELATVLDVLRKIKEQKRS